MISNLNKYTTNYCFKVNKLLISVDYQNHDENKNKLYCLVVLNVL